MRKRLQITTEKGFYLPYVLLVTVISLSVISASVLIYRTEVKSTYMLMEQMENETLIQMGRVKFKQQEMYKHNEKGQVTYTFPNGDVVIQYEKVTENVFSLTFNTKTENNSTFSQLTFLQVDE